MDHWSDEMFESGTDEQDGAEHRGGWHPMDVSHLVMGLVFATMVVLWALSLQGLVTSDDLRWILPLPWVLGGGAGLVALTLGARRRRERGAGQAG